ncbi:MAG: S1C family serine protease, partial [Lachnospiraceae bacterium]|nr:S1C family serine protease [Lachnospiraceae bacterium]
MKKKEEEKDIEQAKKDFIKEQIKEDKKKERFKIFRRIGLTLLLALFFGAVAGTTIYVMDNFLKVRIPFLSEVEDEPINTIDIQNTQPTQATDEQRVSENIDLTDKAALDNYKAASIKYAQIGEMCNDFLVSVVYSKSKSDWFNESISSDEESVGIIFSSDDNNYYIATYDLDSNDSDISIKLNNSNKYSAKIVETGRDDKSAVLSVAKKDISKDDLETIKVAEFADSDTIEIGLPVIAIGKPDGVMHSVMLGKITNDNISTQIVDNELNFFNTDIISDENSEGLVVNESGAVLGIISSDYEEVTGSSHISFIAINDLKSDIQRAANGEKELYLGVTG